MPSLKRTRCKDIYIIAVVFLLQALAVLAPTAGTVTNKDKFSDGSFVGQVAFGSGGGWNNSTVISLERATGIYSANVTLTPSPVIENGSFELDASGIKAGAASGNLTIWNGNLTLGEAQGQWSIANDAGLNRSNITNLSIGGGARLTKDRYGHWDQKADGTFPGREGQSGFWDPNGARMVIYGGHTFSGGDLFFNDMWMYYPDTNSWENRYLNLADAPDKGRTGHSAVLDPATNVMILHGGYYNNVSLGFNIIHTVWKYNISSELWTKMTDAPLDRTNHTAVWDPDGKRMLVFGGISTVGANTVPMNDTYYYLPASDSWAPISTGPMTARSEHTAIWDQTGHQMIISGGIGPAGQQLSDTWTFFTSNNTWSKRSDSPVGLSNHTAVWDEANRQMLVLGPNGKCLYYYPDNDTWEALPDAPYISRRAQSAIWDPAGLRMLMFGGNSTAGAFLKDTWTYSYNFHSTGSLVSAPGRLAYPHALGNVKWDATMAPNTGVTMSVRSSPDNATWSQWEPVTNGTAPHNTVPDMYLQWRANLTTTDGRATPVFNSISLNYTIWNGTGILTSTPAASPGRIVSVTPHMNATMSSGTIALWLSGDNGSHWEPAVPNATHTMANPGKWLSYRMQFNASTDGRSPALSSMVMDYQYESLPTDLSLQMGDVILPIGNLTSPLRLDISEAMRQALASDASFPGPMNVTMAFSSSSSGLLDLTELFISYEQVPPNLPPTVSDPYPADGATINRTTIALSWTGTDPEDEPLLFDIHVDGAIIATGLNVSEYRLEGLTPGKVYDWSIDVSDANATVPGPVWEFTVANDAVANRPPTVTLTSPADGETVNDMTLNLTWDASDPDGDVLEFLVFVEEKGGTSTISSSTNHTSFRVTDLTNGNEYNWWVDALDGVSQTESGKWTFKVRFGPPNSPPVLDKAPLPGATVGTPFTYKLKANDPESDSLVFKLVSGPASLWIAANGTISWTPLKKGTYNLTVQVTDGKANDTYTFTLVVNDKEKASSQSLLMRMWPFLVLAIVLGAVLALAVLYNRRKAAALAAAEAAIASPPTVIDDIFLTYRDGRLITHHTRKLRPETDVDIFTGMFKAVQDFLTESFKVEGQGQINEISYGNSKILIEHGKYVVIAAVVSGEGTKRLHQDMRAAIHNIELENASLLEDWSGDAAVLWESRKWIKMLVNGERIQRIQSVPGGVMAQPPQQAPPESGKIIE